jgi:hypothetical protein
MLLSRANCSLSVEIRVVKVTPSVKVNKEKASSYLHFPDIHPKSEIHSPFECFVDFPGGIFI